VIGATIGIVGSSVNNYRRNRELRSLVRDSASGGTELRNSINDIVAASRQQLDEMRSFLAVSSSSPGTVVDQQQQQASFQPRRSLMPFAKATVQSRKS
jgi:hypothetical protein